jgi:large subunit ribosomal protein L32
MAVPKKKTSKSRTRMRRSHDAVPAANLGSCAQCGAAKQSHRVCPECGFYRGRRILQVVEEEEA